MQTSHNDMSTLHTAACLAAILPLAATQPAHAQQPDASPDSLATASLPLEPTREIRFTTDEGSWMSVDISPDGTTLVFDLLGDLYTLPRRRRHRDPAPHRPRLRKPAALQPRRLRDRLRLRPQRRPEPVGAQRRRLRHDADHTRQRQPLHLARMVARRRVSRRVPHLQPARRRRQTLALPPRRRQRDRADRRTRQPQGHRSRLRPDRPLHLPRPRHPRLELRRGLPAVPARPLRPRDGPPGHGHRPLRLRFPPGRLPRRHHPRLRHPPRGRHRPSRPRPDHR